MRAEYIIGISIFWFVIGFLIADLGAAKGSTPPPPRPRPENPRKPW